eukprot:CAMPEP_0170173814 /NCGR_PEP_ID=MMETSP0040_2-20121228/7082_1 /TAXON_ID=641309 /ORGANISM="Lotharella oceanica, Strain CCMP622" /LENGTH=81 /DNA_ID=CAMNT_0010415175 /DNA_START=236 /DNA_END=481 /DNA_ORIENTATION=-
MLVGEPFWGRGAEVVLVVEEQLVARLQVSLGIDPNVMVAVDACHPRVAVWVISGVVRKLYLIPFAGGVYDPVLVQVEEKAA